MKTSLRIVCFTLFLIFNSFALKSAEMKFTENKGQWDENIRYTSERNGLITSVTKSGIYFDFFNRVDSKTIGNVIKLELTNSNSMNFIPESKSTENYNYFIGNDKSKWITEVRRYSKLVAYNVYEGIDLVYYIENNNPRYDFIIEPYANPENISISFKGVKDINLTDEEVQLITENIVINNTSLFAYQIIDNTKKKIECKFKLDGNNIRFIIGEYDKSKSLVIDPLVYSSFYGASGDDIPSNIKFIDENSFLLVGNTTSADFKTTTGAYSVEYGDRIDAFVTKFNIVNSEYIPEFTTFLGSLEYDNAIDCLIEKDFILVTGVTESPDFPTLKAIKSIHGGGKDIFITSLSLDGKNILQSTFYGGLGDDEVVKVSKIRNNVLLFLGNTTSNNIQTIAGPPSNKYKNGTDILLFTLQPDRTAVTMSAYIGGQLEDFPTDMYIAPSTDYIYITGHTTSSASGSTDFPVAPPKIFGQGGTYDAISNGMKDAFAMVLTPNAQNIEISTFLGGDGDDIGKGIWSDVNQNIFVVGETYNNNSSGVPFPVTTGSAVVQGNSDIFVTMFNDLDIAFGIKTQTLNYSRLLNSQGTEKLEQFKKHPTDSKFSMTLSSDRKFIKVATNESKAKNDIIYTEIEPNTGDVLLSDGYGGNEDDYASCFDFDSFNNYLLAGYSNSNDLKTTDNAYQPKKSANNDVVLIRKSNGNLSLINPPNTQILCANTPVNITWSSEDLNPNDGFQVGYSTSVNDDNFITIAENVMNNSYLWEIPKELSGNKNVKIRVSHNSGLYSQNVGHYVVNNAASLTKFETLSDDTLCLGESIILKATTSGDNVQYVWFKDNKEIAKTTINELNIDNVGFSDAGLYKVSIKNDCPPAITSENTIRVYISPNTKANPIQSSFNKNKGENLEILCDALGARIDYQWQKDGNNLSSQRSKTLKLSNLSTFDAGEYRCILTGECGDDTTNISNLIIKDVIGSVSEIENIDKIANVNEINNNIYRIEVLNNGIFSLELFDNLGNKIEQYEFRNSLEINLNNYSNGLYWIVISKNDKMYRTKLLKIN